MIISQNINEKKSQQFDFQINNFQNIISKQISVKPYGIQCLIQLNQKLIASGDNVGQIKIWNINKIKLIRNLYKHQDKIWPLIPIKQGKLLSGSGDQKIILWNWKKGNLLKLINIHEGCIRSILLYDSYIISQSESTKIHIWKLNSGRQVITWKAHNDIIKSIIMINYDNLISFSNDRFIKLWSINNQQCLSSVFCERYFWSALQVNYNLIALGPSSGSIHLYEIPSLSCIKILKGHKTGSLIYRIIKLNNQHVASCSSDKQVIIWDIIKAKPTLFINNHNSDVVGLTMFNQDQIITGSWDGTIKIIK